MNEKEIFNTTIPVIGGFLTYIFGGWNTCLIVQVALVIIYDWCVGGACIQKQVSTAIGRRGIHKKAIMLIVLIVAFLLDRLINNGTWVFRTLMCHYYIANECISLLENVVKIINVIHSFYFITFPYMFNLNGLYTTFKHNRLNVVYKPFTIML